MKPGDDDGTVDIDLYRQQVSDYLEADLKTQIASLRLDEKADAEFIKNKKILI